MHAEVHLHGKPLGVHAYMPKATIDYWHKIAPIDVQDNFLFCWMCFSSAIGQGARIYISTLVFLWEWLIAAHFLWSLNSCPLYAPKISLLWLFPFIAVYLIILTFSYGFGAVMPHPSLERYRIHCQDQCSEVLSNRQKWMELSLKILLQEAHPRNLAAVLVAGVLKSQRGNILRPVLRRKEVKQDLQGRSTWLLMTKMLKREKTMTTKLMWQMKGPIF